MSEARKIVEIVKSKPVLEGAGVHLNRSFGFGPENKFDPFLLFDDFSSDRPEHYRQGFPWHPHRGIETITYVLAGDVEHQDSLGNKGVISTGDIQWMSAGSGIIHQEMPNGDDKGRMYGFQLWANLPSHKKMSDPGYQGISGSDIPEINLESGVRIKVIAGKMHDVVGPVRDVYIDPEYLDITVPKGGEFSYTVERGRTLFAYVYKGTGCFSEELQTTIENRMTVLFGEGDEFRAFSKSDDFRFLLVSGNPLNEPVAWQGPIVMNTQEELEVAFQEYRNGTFVKVGGSGMM